MTNYHAPRHRRHPASSQKQRFKRPLIVLTYHGDQLTAIHSSTSSVQFVRLDISPAETPETEEAGFPAPGAARQLSIPLLSEMSPILHRAAQKAFRPS